MAFAPVFRRGFPATFDRNAAAAVSWWLTGGIAAANCIAAYQPKGAASLAASYTNLANPGTYNAAPGTAPTWDAVSGWIFNGTTQYLRTTFIPMGDKTGALLVRFSDRTEKAGALPETLCGVTQSGVGSIALTPQDGYNGRAIRNIAAATTYADGALNSGVIGFAGTVGFLNGATYLTLTGGTGGTYTKDISIGARHYYEPGYEVFNADPIQAYIQAFVYYNITITDAQVLAVSTAMAAL